MKQCNCDYNKNNTSNNFTSSSNQNEYERMLYALQTTQQEYQNKFKNLIDQLNKIEELESNIDIQNLKNEAILYKKKEQFLQQASQTMINQSIIRLKELENIYNPNSQRLKKVAVINSRTNRYLVVRKALLLNNNYDFSIYTDKLCPVDVIPDIIWNVKVDYDDEVQTMVSHFPNMGEAYHNKMFFYMRLQEFDEKNIYSFNSKDFYKKTYIFNPFIPDISESEKQLYDIQNQQNLDENQLYIEKFPKLSLGHGIFIQKNITNFINHIKMCKLVQRKNSNSKYKSNCRYDKIKYKLGTQYKIRNSLLQEYIQNPMLLDNRKFDIRTYVLSLYTGKYFIYYMSNSYIRRAYDYYQTQDLNKSIHATHLQINDVFQYNMTLWEEKINRSALTMPEFEKEYSKEKNVTLDDIYKLYHRQKQIITYAIQAGSSQLKLPNKQQYTLKKGQFHMLGCDTMFDDKSNPWLMECNVNPQIDVNFKQKKESLENTVKSLVDIVLYFHDNWDNMDQVAKNPKNIPNGVLEMIYNEAIGFNIINQQYKSKQLSQN